MSKANGFDGNAAFSGDGFMHSQPTQPLPNRPSSSKNSDARRLIPLTVKKLNDLTRVGESGISIDGGVDVNSDSISLVGRVSKINNSVSDCTFIVDDCTGWVECTKWIHEHVDSVEVNAISVGMYVRVCGQFKCIQIRRTLHTFSIRPVTDFNEIVNHFLECIYVHVCNTKLRGGMTTQPQITNSVGSMTSPPQFSVQHCTDELIRVVSSRVLQFLRRPEYLASETGASSDVVARELNVSYDKIRKSLDFLVSESLVYTTTDDHYKFTDA